MKTQSAKPPDVDANGVPYLGSRIGECGLCGGHVMTGGGHPVPLPPRCASCGATAKTTLAMNDDATGEKKGWRPRKRSNAD